MSVTRSNLRKEARTISRQNIIGPILSETGQDVRLLGRLKDFENGSRFAKVGFFCRGKIHCGHSYLG